MSRNVQMHEQEQMNVLDLRVPITACEVQGPHFVLWSQV